MKKKIIFLTIILALVLTYATGLIKRNDISYDIKPECTDCITGYTTYGFPLESSKYVHGGFTGGMSTPLIGLLFNFVIYLIITGIFAYLVFRRKSKF